MHVHIGLVEAIKIFLYVIIIGFFWRVGALILSENGHDQASAAMTLVY